MGVGTREKDNIGSELLKIQASNQTVVPKTKREKRAERAPTPTPPPDFTHRHRYAFAIGGAVVGAAGVALARAPSDPLGATAHVALHTAFAMLGYGMAAGGTAMTVGAATMGGVPGFTDRGATEMKLPSIIGGGLKFQKP
jgi:hypothetical protein